MIRIDEIYTHTFGAWFARNRPRNRVFYCEPFGRTDIDSIHSYAKTDSRELNYTLFFDQEPIDLSRHLATFEHVKYHCNSDIHQTELLSYNQGTLGAIVTSEKNSATVEQLCQRFGWRQYYYFYHGWAALDWYRGYDYTYAMPNPDARKISKTFINPNRIIGGERKHRLITLYYIFKYGLTNNHISCPAVCPAENTPILECVKTLLDSHPDAVEVFSKEQFPKNFVGESGSPMHSAELSLFRECSESLLYLVTETVATGQRLHLTEKSFKPICLRMPFIIVGTRGSLEYLRSYGFKTFNHLWDESYDNEINDDQRIEKIAFTLRALDSLPIEEKQRLFELAQEVCEHNYNHFYGGGFEAILKQELTAMLESLPEEAQYNFVMDSTIPLATTDTDLVNTYPYVVEPAIVRNCRDHVVDSYIWSIDNAPKNSYYPIGIGFFDHTVDYFALLPIALLPKLNNGTVRVLFYYHEGDDPRVIKQRLDSLITLHSLPRDCYRFVSGNTIADRLDNFAYFPEHELLYWRQNLWVEPTPIHNNTRSKDFTLLSRTHKAWRATIVADLHRNGLLDNSYWSYNTSITVDDHIRRDNPIQIDFNLPGLAKYIPEFLAGGPYQCDTLTSSEHNDHSRHVLEHYNDSYCHLVLETMYDCGGSGGTFITEKTYKPIKHGQPFVIFGPHNTLKLLRELGYRTFDQYIDNSYDTIEDNTRRYLAARTTVQQIKNNNMQRWFELCMPDIIHNQKHYTSYKRNLLNTLRTKLN